MKEPYIEGVATHDGPESCAVVCEGGGEAWTGVRAGRVIEPRNQRSGVPTPSLRVEGNTADGGRRESSVGPARSESQACTESPCARSGRSHCSPAGLIAGGPLRER